MRDVRALAKRLSSLVMFNTMGQLKLYTLANTNPNTNPNPNPMRHCGRGSGCTQHYLNYDAKVNNSSLPILCWNLMHYGQHRDQQQITMWLIRILSLSNNLYTTTSNPNPIANPNTNPNLTIFLTLTVTLQWSLIHR